MTIAEFLQILRRRWVYLVVAVVLGGALGAAAYLTATPQYRSSATVYFSVPIATTAGDLVQGSDYAQQQLMSYAELATQPMVLNPVIHKLGLPESPQKLAGAVSAVASNNTVLITVSATDPSAQRAASIANAVAGQLGSTVTALSPKSPTGHPTVTYAIAGRAFPAPFPKSPKKKVDLGAGVLGGLILGLLAALARDRLDTRIFTERELVGITALGRIPFQRSAAKNGSSLITEWTERSSRAEAFRHLRTSLQFVDVDSPMKIITVTSSVASEGKSDVASNLALAFAEAGRRVLLIDADLRRPAVADYFGIEGAVGLTNVLAGHVEADEVIQDWGGNRRRLSILPSGSTPPNPSELLGSNRMAALIELFRKKYDVVLIDTPPLLPVTDAAVLSAHADGAVVVTRYGKTKKSQIRAAMANLDAVDAKVLGAVINRVPVERRGGGYGNYYGVVDPSGPVAPTVSAKGIAEKDEELVDSVSAESADSAARRSAGSADSSDDRSYPHNGHSASLAEHTVVSVSR